jgi:hypothetical protein
MKHEAADRDDAAIAEREEAHRQREAKQARRREEMAARLKLFKKIPRRAR